MHQRISAWMAIIGFTISVAACGGGGGSDGSTGSSGGATGDTSVPGLEVSDQMSLVTAKGSGQGNLARALKGLKAVPTGGQFVTDVPSIFVDDRSMDALSMINEILCAFDQTRYADMVNRGNYIALIDNNLCRQNLGAASDSSNESAGEPQSFETWTVNSQRVDAISPHIVQVWFTMNAGERGEDPFEEIRAQVAITEAASDNNPFGIFSIDIVGLAQGQALMHGNISVSEAEDGRLEIEMVMGSEPMFLEQVHVLLTDGGTEGQAFARKTMSFEGFSEDESVQVAFTDDLYFADFGDSQSCLNRNEFDEFVWRYNLYDGAGARVSRNSGMGILYGDDDHMFGWAGYYGVWLPEEITITSGMAVRDKNNTPFTIFQAPGRLIRRERHTMTLGELVGDYFSKWNEEDHANDRVMWDGTNLVSVGQEVCNENGCTFVASDEPIIIPLEAGQWVGLWKDGFGNIDLSVPESGVLSNSMVVPYHTQEFISPSSDIFANGALILQCYYHCLRPGLTQADVDRLDLYFPEAAGPDEAYTYLIDPSDLTLTFNGQPIVLPEGLDTSSNPDFWGIHSGAMLPYGTALDSVSNVGDQAVTYEWETGVEQWNKFSSLIDANGVAVEFEAPLRCLYEDEEHGTFFLSYEGEGELHGIPHVRVESDDEWDHWVPTFSIADGASLTCDDTEYFVRPMELEQVMHEADVSVCSGLSAGDIGAPEDHFSDPGMGEVPTVTDAPAVIGGIVQ